MRQVSNDPKNDITVKPLVNVIINHFFATTIIIKIFHLYSQMTQTFVTYIVNSNRLAEHIVAGFQQSGSLSCHSIIILKTLVNFKGLVSSCQTVYKGCLQHMQVTWSVGLKIVTSGYIEMMNIIITVCGKFQKCLPSLCVNK